MKFLIDANLPPRLCASRRHDADHLFDLDLLDATDTEIWRRASARILVLVSKDVDFHDRALLFGAPPQVVHVGVGNCSNARLFEILTIEWDEIERALSSGSRLISITQEKLEVFAWAKLKYTEGFEGLQKKIVQNVQAVQPLRSVQVVKDKRFKVQCKADRVQGVQSPGSSLGSVQNAIQSNTESRPRATIAGLRQSRLAV